MHSAETLHLPSGTAGDGDDPLVIDPASAGWKYASLRIVQLHAGSERVFATGENECAILPLGGHCCVSVDTEDWTLTGRQSPFEGASDFVYAPRDSEVTITAPESCRIAIPSAPARTRMQATYVAAEDVEVEVRGEGSAERKIVNFLAPHVPLADRLTCVEVLTPGGSWSSYPPHKHDRAVPGGEAELEEIYYFEVDGEGGYGLHRTYDLEQGWDVTVTVHSGDAFLVPSGYHGPCAAAPGFDLYYLNVLAGPGEERSLAFSDDPRYHWIREQWAAAASGVRA
jgi:5-deoxy-glucuronate isomerase